MAKWGEGDPRWIVEERPDATNVNNWHWTEKNADAWSKKLLKELLVGLEVSEPGVCCVKITEMDSITGEARLNNRKAKLILFYEWDMSLKWEGKMNGAERATKGNIKIPNLSEEHTDMKDVTVEVTVTDKAENSEILKTLMRKKGADLIREKLASYVESLRTDFTKGLILPNKGTNGVAPPPEVKKPSNNVLKDIRPTNETQTPVKFKTLEQTETFKCTGSDLYNALTQKVLIQAYMGSPPSMKDDVGAVGTAFSFLNGNIEGEFLETTHPTKVRQKWRLKSWPKDHYSEVTFTISEKEGDAILELKQTEIPEKEYENTSSGWKKYYWDSIKRRLGYGAAVF